MKLKVFGGDLQKIETLFNEWTSSEQVKVVDMKIACSVDSFAVSQPGFELGGLSAPRSASIANTQMVVLAVLYEEVGNVSTTG